jgi:hypothetical protein
MVLNSAAPAGVPAAVLSNDKSAITPPAALEVSVASAELRVPSQDNIVVPVLEEQVLAPPEPPPPSPPPPVVQPHYPPGTFSLLKPEDLGRAMQPATGTNTPPRP